MLRDAVHGVLFRSGDVDDCRQSLERFAAASAEQVSQWRAACGQLACEFPLERECESYLALFAETSAARLAQVAHLPAKGSAA